MLANNKTLSSPIRLADCVKAELDKILFRFLYFDGRQSEYFDLKVSSEQRLDQWKAEYKNLCPSWKLHTFIVWAVSRRKKLGMCPCTWHCEPGNPNQFLKAFKLNWRYHPLSQSARDPRVELMYNFRAWLTDILQLKVFTFTGWSCEFEGETLSCRRSVYQALKLYKHFIYLQCEECSFCSAGRKQGSKSLNLSTRVFQKFQEIMKKRTEG